MWKNSEMTSAFAATVIDGHGSLGQAEAMRTHSVARVYL